MLVALQWRREARAKPRLGDAPSSHKSSQGEVTSTGARRACPAPLQAATRSVARPCPPTGTASGQTSGPCISPRPLPLPLLGAGSSINPARCSRSSPTRALIAAWAGPVRRSTAAPGIPVARSPSATADSPPQSRGESSPGPPHRTAARTACSVSPRPSALAPSVVMREDFNRYGEARVQHAATLSSLRCG